MSVYRKSILPNRFKLIFNMKSVLICLISLFLFSAAQAQVDISSIKINTQISLYLSLDELRSSFVIDSITGIPDIMDMSEADSLIYIGSTYFECYLASNSCELSVFQFGSQMKNIRIGSRTLDEDMSIKEVQSILPGECKELSSIQIYGEEEEYEYCRIQLMAPSGKLIDQSLLLFFLDKQLKRIDF